MTTALFWTLFTWAGLVIVPVGICAWLYILKEILETFSPAGFMRSTPTQARRQQMALVGICVLAGWAVALCIHGLGA